MLGQTLKGRYKIYDEVGSGGFATVYLARDIAANTVVAIKTLHTELGHTEKLVSRFTREVEIAQRLRNPHLVQVIDHGVENGTYFTVMEYVQGRTLANLIKKQGPFSVEETLALAVQALDGLSAMHDAGIIHRDIKPHNMMLTPEGVLKIMDFGIAKELAAAEGLTDTGAAIGTPHYIAPEQINGSNVDGRTDLYALGIVLYQLLTGQLPFQGTTTWEIINKRMIETPLPLSQIRGDVDPYVDNIIQRALERDPAMRWNSASAMKAVITDYLNTRSTGNRQASIPPLIQPIVQPNNQTVAIPLTGERNTHSAAQTPYSGVAGGNEQNRASQDYAQVGGQFQTTTAVNVDNSINVGNAVNRVGVTGTGGGYGGTSSSFTIAGRAPGRANMLKAIMLGILLAMLIFCAASSGLIFIPGAPLHYLVKSNSPTASPTTPLGVNIPPATATGTSLRATATTSIVTPAPTALPVSASDNPTITPPPAVETETPPSAVETETPPSAVETATPSTAVVTATPILAKRIVVSLSKETVTLYNGNTEAGTYPCSTGKGNASNDIKTATFTGNFSIYDKKETYNTATGIKQWWMAFDKDHANGFFSDPHDDETLFGHPTTNGGILLHLSDGKTIYDWADSGTLVSIEN